jgi:hypothetical protein
MSGRFAVLLVTIAVIACQTPAVLAPTKDAAGCSVDTEHDCAGGGCCLQGYTCGGAQPGLPVTCESGYCCDEEPTSTTYGMRKRMRKRLP